MNDKIEEGDDVKHKDPYINNGLKMCVEEIDEAELNAQCSYHLGTDTIPNVGWFPLADLTLVKKADGGFFN